MSIFPSFENFTLYASLMDLCYASILLIFAQLCRSKIKILQNLYIPASLLAGIIGLLLGPQFLRIFNYSTQASSYAGVLLIPMYAQMALGYKKPRNEPVIATINKVKRHYFGSALASWWQYMMAGLVGLLLAKTVWPDLELTFGLLLASGFAGGHGNATAMGTALEEYGFEGATGIGLTFATVGLLSGIIIGMININIAVRRNSTRFVKYLSQTPEELRTGWIPDEKRTELGKGTMSPALSIRWHGILHCLSFAAVWVM